MRRFFLLFIIFSFSAPSFPQMPDLNFTQIANEDKLSGNFATCIEQDNIGYIWIGTTNGLNRYDGYDFNVYHHKADDNAGLVSDNILCLYNDSKGRLWIGSGFGLCIYNRSFDAFDRIVDMNDSSGLKNISITQVSEDHKNSIFIASNECIYFFDEDKRCFSELLAIDHGVISSFVFDKNNNLWIGASSQGGLYYYNRNKTKLTRYIHDENDPNSISNNTVMSFALKDEKIWIATDGGGINSYSINTGVFKQYLSNDSYGIYGRKVYVDRKNNLWTLDLTGLKFFDEKSDVFYGYYYEKDDPFTIKKSAVDIFQDKQGNYWTLHSPGGVGISIVPKGFFSFSNNPSEYWHTSNENISAICEDNSGNLWLGNSNNGIDIFYWSEGKTVTYIYDPENIYSLGKGSVNTIFRDRNNKMWTGTYFGGLQYFDESSGRFITYINHPDDTNSLACNDVRSVCEDREGNLWLVVHGKGVDRFDRKKNVFYHYNSVNNHLSNNWAFQVICDDFDDIWVATVWGLNRLKKSGTVFENYFMIENDTNSLSSSDIVCLYKDSDDQIWIGTNNGLNLYNQDEKKIKRINVPLKNNHICAILEDRNKDIWVSTPGGISRIDPRSLKTVNFDTDDGLPANEFYPRSVYKNDVNGLFFGSIKGLSVFNPDSLKMNKERPPVLISNFKLFYEDILEYSPRSILKKPISQTDTIILKYRQNIITFEFTALNMIHPEKNQYAYMMEGFDKKWNDIGTKREATYTNLSPGRYIFRVKASNNDGYWNETGAMIYIRIKPPWYRSWWFYVITGFSVLGIFALFFIVRTAQLRKQKDLLTIKVKERTKELSDKNEELKTQAEDLNNANAQMEERQQLIEEQSQKLAEANDELRKLNSSKDKFFSIIAHDLRGPFQNILGFSEMLSDNYADMDDLQKKEIAENINISSKKVFHLLENLLKWAASQTNNISFTPEILNIKDIIDESVHILNDMASNKKIEIIFNKPEVENVFADSEMVKTVIRNLIGNALKFTLSGGTVEIGVTGKKHFAQISVKDNGIGMDKKYLQNLFSIENMESRPGTDNERGSGLGLILCKEFVEKNGGKLTVESSKGTGSKFSFTLPLVTNPN
jgi:signal transduction histidine kinase/ligand-binding sensor domain-containing protein